MFINSTPTGLNENLTSGCKLTSIFNPVGVGMLLRFP
jgi:hypothetical protein